MFTYTGSDNSHQSLDAEEAIQAAVHSQYLDLSSRCLQSLPASLAVCGGLQVLHLSTNALQTLPALLGSLKTLTELDVSYNQLVSLPVEVASLTALTSLKLSYNRLESLGEEVAQLVSIRVLHLNDNQLVSVPAELSCLQGLEDLQLQYNSLSTLPQALSQLTQLTTLDLSGNPLPPPLLKVGAAGAATTAIDVQVLLSIVARTGLPSKPKSAATNDYHAADMSRASAIASRPPRPHSSESAGVDLLLLDDDGSILAQPGASATGLTRSNSHGPASIDKVVVRSNSAGRIRTPRTSAGSDGICITGPSSHAAAVSADSTAAAAVASSLQTMGMGLAELNELPPAAAAVLYRTCDAVSTGVQEVLSGRPLTRGGIAGISSASVRSQLGHLYRPPSSASRRPPTAPGTSSGAASRPGTAGAGQSSRPLSAGRTSMTLEQMLALTSAPSRPASQPPYTPGSAAHRGAEVGRGQSGGGAQVGRGTAATIDEEASESQDGLHGMSAITFPLASGVRSMLRRGSPASSRQPSRPASGGSVDGNSADGIALAAQCGGPIPEGAASSSDVPRTPWRSLTAGGMSGGTVGGTAGGKFGDGDDGDLDVVKGLLLGRNRDLLLSLNSALSQGAHGGTGGEQEGEDGEEEDEETDACAD